MMRLSAICILIFGFMAASCGSDDDGKKTPTRECTTNADCESFEVCDQTAGTCVVFVGSNNENNSNNTNNVRTNNGTQNNGSNNANNQNNTNNGAVCGNAIVEEGEVCDSNCPVDCNDMDACTVDTLTGSAQTCDALCSNEPIEACTDADGCCPAGCDGSNDSDCLAETCGNGAVDGGESCDSAIPAGNPGACPVAADCIAEDACTTASFSGDAQTCSATCTIDTETQCVDDDGCCPSACDNTLDNDCGAAIGDACADNAECETGFCSAEAVGNWPGGYCSAGCMVDSDCTGPNTVCAGRVCVEACASPQDCRADYTCGDLFGAGKMYCTPDATALSLDGPGGACTDESDCLGNFFSVSCAQPEAGFAGGYCASGCQVDADCPDQSHCLITENGGGFCAPDCASAGDCRAGYDCFGYLDDPQNTCGPVASGTGVVGAACDFLQDCSGGPDGLCLQNPDFQDGYCSETCLVDSDCPTGNHCAFDQGQEGICMQDCTAGMTTCRAGYECFDGDEDQTTECFPSGVGQGLVGDSCDGLYQCTGGQDAVCIGEASGWRSGYCSESCNVDTDCPQGSHCGFNSAGEGLCLEDCLNSADCRTDGYGCLDTDDDAVNECAPAGTGTQPPGGSCAGVWECAGGNGAFCISEDRQDWPGGYCAVSGCLADADCGPGSHCGFDDPMTGEGVCIDSCTSDADCRASYGCYDLDGDVALECLPAGTRPVGSACQSFVNCAGRENALCATDDDGFPDGYCLQDCGLGGTTCPAGSECVTLDSGASFCFDQCTNAGECRTGYSCLQATMNSGNVCLP